MTTQEGPSAAFHTPAKRDRLSKRIVRSRPVQLALASIFAAYLRFVYATIRWTYEGRENGERVWSQPGGVMLCFWHARIPLSPCTWGKDSAQTMHALVSKSSDGEFITQTVARLGFPSIRGSRAREDSVGDKGGSGAFREMARGIKAGNAVAITPDGPKGPAQVLAEGPPILARTTGARVLLAGVACNPCIRAKSWDRAVFPLPFGRGAVVWEGPLAAGRDDDPAALALDWGKRLNAITERAEALVA